ncbi:MAG: hypothetical protein IPL92_02280 [Saprospiraceae bacterium]|nr:hypothetical protein [Candidatus Opimibacter iunctus]
MDRRLTLLFKPPYLAIYSSILLFGILNISGCSPEISSLSWMTGTWEMPKPNGHVRLEIWQKENGRGLRGKGVSVAQGDTTGLETIALYKDQNHIWYVPVVSDQNEGQPVPFKLVSDSDIHFVFENPEHDFPTANCVSLQAS